MFVTYYNEHLDRYTVSRLDSAKRCGLDIISKHRTYRQAEQAAYELNEKARKNDVCSMQGSPQRKAYSRNDEYGEEV